MSAPSDPKNQSNAHPRPSAACLRCRSRHLKCDGAKPACNRCALTATDCLYAPSRRGGLNRAALAERRKRLAANADSNALIDAYYTYFHPLHPFIVPRNYFARLEVDAAGSPAIKALTAVMRLIGNIYIEQSWSVELNDQVQACLPQANQDSPFMVQARLLYSVVLFWNGRQTEAKEELGLATNLALELGIQRQDYADAHSKGDPVLAESWRRTWWSLYIISAYYAGTLGTMNFTVMAVEATVDLPCEESEYETGEIPEPKTVEDFENREFASEEVSFSSFAYLIGAVKCAALAVSIAPRVLSNQDSPRIIQEADSIIDAWSLLLPTDRTQVMNKAGQIDELLFQAHLLIHVATIGLHRPLSSLRFNPVEDVSSCAREHPPETPRPELADVHTVRVLRSVEAQIRLLALPSRPFHHTPFTTCMISEGSLALLSACNFLLEGRELAVARDQIRLIIGCLKALGDLWPRTAKNVREIQTIARHVLGLGGRKTDNSSSGTPVSGRVPSLSASQGSVGSMAEPVSDETSEVPPFDPMSMNDVCGWYSMEDFGPQFAEWISNEQ
ncbi:C6 zinc finger protein [Plectosphaerella plurivora]|uniref:C6 zinc finger protein n=1 Tax=Plectosphaerella plurivora TaxID=936078 RepID=A0A9P8V9L0_9PEZI|nr:C6 zinc finger protein [Plectosphaerella plurivora]